jgi:putative transposase
LTTFLPPRLYSWQENQCVNARPDPSLLVRASMTDDPSDYRWSSYHHNALGQPDKLIESHADYLRLGSDPAERQAAYRELFRAHIDPGILKAIRQATQTNRVFGSELFQNPIEAALALPIQKRKPGPRRKESS